MTPTTEQRPIVVAGEALVDLVVATDGSIAAHLGGGPFNAARIIGRLGRPVTFVGTISTDLFGRRHLAALRDAGVRVPDDLRVEAPSTLALAELGEDGAATYRFYFEGTAAPQLDRDRLAAALPAEVGALHVGTLGLVLEPMASSLEQLVLSPPEGALVSIDPNCRPAVVGRGGPYEDRIRRCMRHAHLVKLSDDDARFLRPDVAPERLAAEIAKTGPRIVLLTRGEAGVHVFGSGWEVRVPAPRVEVVDTVGAGDAMAGGFLAWWSEHALGVDDLAERDAVLEAVTFGAQVASTVCARPGADPPGRDELDALRALTSGPGETAVAGDSPPPKSEGRE